MSLFALVACVAEPGDPGTPSTSPSDPSSPPSTPTPSTATSPTSPTSPTTPPPSSTGAADPCVAAGTCPPGVWVEVTPPDLASLEFGPGPVVVDPRHPTDLYLAGGGDGVWKSDDYGGTWTQLDPEIGYVPMGLVLAVAGTEPATVWVAGYHVTYRSTDGGLGFTAIPNTLPAELYSLQLDPDDDRHLISGLHEADGLVESTDGGDTWTTVEGAGWPSGGISWYPFFVDGGDPAVTRQTWFAIAQNGGSPVITRDGGATWTTPSGLDGLTHAHGNAQIFQSGSDLFVPGIGGPGDGLYRSTDGGASFTRVLDGALSVAWGSSSSVYAMWGWACASCDLGASFHASPLPGDAWTAEEVPPELIIGANHVAVTSDGERSIFVGTMWASGIWKYVEP